MDVAPPTKLFFSAFGVSACAGLAALLRSGNRLSKVAILSSLLNSGLLGLGISLLWYVKFADDPYFLVGVCVLAGLGGMTTVDFVLRAIRRGLSLRMGENEAESPLVQRPRQKKEKKGE